MRQWPMRKWSMHGRRSNGAPGNDDAAGLMRWYRQPIVWLGIAILALSLAGCIWMIVLGGRHADVPLPTGDEQLLKVPLRRSDQP